ncbi:2Fe-2S iron-sulfur cluster-binding protein [Paracoccus saliphilus]|uniref:(2Fe-2S)-binding protein n=1 Tax=Paracoccus saliphilus TaxID=405559 RepID=A0AA45W511_9RHOB|nr:2Fe-2S iron-sulfur cluster-binding protein [Paracoccus saliphilus]WCR02116.1 (2Fe-2S)-binding protein [Paracoccus saliphilus]SIS90184.1 N-methylglutamate dehydrogenase subunit C [Paracoccus saliphilus]
MPEHVRLPAPWGTRIHRATPLRFSFDGKTLSGLKGDTVASAMLASGRWVFSRSFKYHRPRGPLTMCGQDSNTLVQIGSEPNVRADRQALTEGLAVNAQNTSHNADRDRGSLLDRLGRFLPVGFYYRSFFGPTRNSWLKLWEPVIRKSAGLGVVDTGQGDGNYRKRNLRCDVLVVGAGLAGCAAARAAATAGARVVLVDSEPETGGALTYERDNEARLAEARAGLDHPQITVLTDATCNGWYADNFLPVIQGNLLYRVRAAQVVVACGTQEQPLIFRNNDLPGIVTAAQRLMRHYAVKPGERAVVFAGTPHGVAAAMDLLEAGVQLAAILLPAENPELAKHASPLADQGVWVIASARVLAGQGAKGSGQLCALDVETQAGRETLTCDLAVIDAGATPGYQLPLHAGAKLGFDDARQSFTLSSYPDSMHLAGAVAGIFSPDAVIQSGERAGAAAARALGHDIPLPDAPPDPDAALYRTYPVPDPDKAGRDFVDFDEDLQVKDIVNAVADGYSELELVKRYSTVGMGPSQGRHSALQTARIVAAETGRSVGQIGVTTARPPFGPEKLGLLAGPLRMPERLTALDTEHRAEGAKMTPVGAWWRPLYYGGGNAQEIIAREVRSVREDVAMLDVSTLGKLAVRGPEAAAFLDRIYTMSHGKQPVGRVRYCLMLNEMGSVVDDGVAYRMAEDDFYVTATTGAVDRVFSDMSWWRTQWRMDVDIQNITAAFAGINVTGPRAREVLKSLEGDVELDRDSFGFLEGRSGVIAGCPVRIMRIGFTGELSYELHTPGSYARALWAALRNVGVAPYGLEASRVLRLEKGHIIIGQDTDALSTPDELDMGWALSKKKPYYLGKPAADLRRSTGLSRKLCRFEAPLDLSGEIGESCLVMKNGVAVGNVTSVLPSPTTGRLIGLAFAAPDDAVPGGRIAIRTRSGREVMVRTVSHAFYDPENNRQDG